MAGSISWKQFEAIVARLQKSFAHQGVVTENDHIMGRISGRRRQIDISVRATIGAEDILMVIECKKWNRKIDVKAVEQFSGLKRDVGANLGIMVSTEGFTRAAQRAAEHEGINLYRYEDSIKSGWPNGIETNVLIEIWELTPKAAYHLLADGTQESIVSDAELDFVEISSGEKCGLATLVRKAWEKLPDSEKYERLWGVEIECTTPERPEIRKLGLGAESKLVRGFRRGRMQFEGLVSEREGHAKVDGWKMVFAGPMHPLASNEAPPNSTTISLKLKSIHVRTQDLKTERMADLIYSGILEMSVKTPGLSKLPISSSKKQSNATRRGSQHVRKAV